MSVIVVATFFPKPGMHDAVHAVIAAAQTEVYKEPGCELYALHESSDRFVLIEKWASEEAIAAHGEAEALAKLVEDVTPLVDGKIDIVSLSPVDSGHELGAL